MTFSRAHHQAIEKLLFKFDPDFLQENNILFGGGTRIALELSEFRESVDIDLFCIGKSSYRAARSSVTNISFGPLLRPGEKLNLLNGREIRADRDAIRAVLKGPENPIKLEIIKFENNYITSESRNDLFPIPCVSHEGCFATKLTANADRLEDNIKDIMDLCMMRLSWGEIPNKSWDIACDEYGEDVIRKGLLRALEKLTRKHEENIAYSINSLHIEKTLAEEIIKSQAPAWLKTLA